MQERRKAIDHDTVSATGDEVDSGVGTLGPSTTIDDVFGDRGSGVRVAMGGCE